MGRGYQAYRDDAQVAVADLQSHRNTHRMMMAHVDLLVFLHVFSFLIAYKTLERGTVIDHCDTY